MTLRNRFPDVSDESGGQTSHGEPCNLSGGGSVVAMM
jgi:hypothetical protein